MSLHDKVKEHVLFCCKSLDFQAKTEYRGKDWRADVFVLANGIKYAIEVQTTKQSLNRTLERQKKYKRDGVVGCWLFESEPTKQKEEREDLPLFSIMNVDDKTIVSIKGRKDLPLEVFLSDFLKGKIKFCQTIRLHEAEIIFVNVRCWRCGYDYHIYYIGNLFSPCNTTIFHNEAMWISEKLAFKPEIITKANDHVSTAKEKNLVIGPIKERYSKTAETSYVSFGCPKCDAIFGDWFLHEVMYDFVDNISIKGNFITEFGMNIPHWCHPGEHKFCEEIKQKLTSPEYEI